MAWRRPTVSDLAARLSQAELDSYRKSPDAAGGGDPVEALLDGVAAMVRMACRTNGRVRLSPRGGEIPESLMGAAMDWAAFDVLKRIPTTVGMTEARKTARDEAKETFRRVSEGSLLPEPYAEGGVEATDAGRPMPSFSEGRADVLGEPWGRRG